MKPVVAHVEDLFLVGDFEGAEALVGALVSERQGEAAAGRAPAAAARSSPSPGRRKASASNWCATSRRPSRCALAR
jgi:hypothetical protein